MKMHKGTSQSTQAQHRQGRRKAGIGAQYLIHGDSQGQLQPCFTRNVIDVSSMALNICSAKFYFPWDNWHENYIKMLFMERVRQQNTCCRCVGWCLISSIMFFPLLFYTFGFLPRTFRAYACQHQVYVCCIFSLGYFSSFFLQKSAWQPLPQVHTTCSPYCIFSSLCLIFHERSSMFPFFHDQLHFILTSI